MNINFLCKRWLPAILLVLLAGITVYSNTFQVPFVLDDQSSIVNNIAIKKVGNVFHAYKIDLKFIQNRFVGFLTFALNYHFGGLDVAGYHVVNLVIHLAASLLVYTLLHLTFRTPYFQEMGRQSLNPQSSVLSPQFFIPLFGALLFVIHPVQTQAVTYIVQRLTSLATMFYLLSVVLYVKARLSIVGIQNCGRLTGQSGVKTKESEVRNQESGVGSQNSESKIQNQDEKTHSENVKGRIKPWLLIAGSTLAAVLAMKTKEISFTLPFTIILYEVYFFRGPWKHRFLYLLPLLATLPIIPMTAIDIGGPSGDIVSGADNQLRVGSSMPRMDYLFTQFRVIVTYLRLLVFPVNLNLDYDYPVYTSFFTTPVLMSFTLLIAIFTLAVYLFWRSRWTTRPQSQPESQSQSKPAFRLISYGIIWFFLTLSVESSLVPIKDVIMEYRLYLPFFGAAAAFVMIFYLMVEKLTGPTSGKLLYLSATLLVIVLGFTTYQRNHVWGNAIRLWQDVVVKSPGKGRPINNLGVALDKAGRRPEAFNTLSQAIAVDPNYYKSYYNLADLYLVSDQPDVALRLLQTAIKLNPNFTEAYVSMGAALMRAGKFREVIIFLEMNLDRITNNAEARFYLGASYAFLGDREAAMRELAILSKLDPSYAANLAGMLGLKPRQGTPREK